MLPPSNSRSMPGWPLRGDYFFNRSALGRSGGTCLQRCACPLSWIDSAMAGAENPTHAAAKRTRSNTMTGEEPKPTDYVAEWITAHRAEIGGTQLRSAWNEEYARTYCAEFETDKYLLQFCAWAMFSLSRSTMDKSVLAMSCCTSFTAMGYTLLCSISHGPLTNYRGGRDRIVQSRIARRHYGCSYLAWSLAYC